MSSTLYRKYRPSTFTEVIGQKAIKQTLENEVITKKIAHAYLFAGPRGVGKTTIARVLAKALNCKDRKAKASEPCNKCDFCLSINEGKALDLIEIDAASNRGIDDIRGLREYVKYPPAQMAYKIFIIDEVHMLTPEAFNALLKTLEEPPKYIIFILATTEVSRLPETIVSRCQRFDFKKIPLDEMVERLKKIVKEENIKVDNDVLELISRRSDGCSRDAESLLGQVLALGVDKITLDEVSLVIPRSDLEKVLDWSFAVLEKDVPSALNIINEIVETGSSLTQFWSDLLEFNRQLLIFLVTKEFDRQGLLALTKEQQKQIRDKAKNISVDEVARLVNLLLEMGPQMKSAEIPQLPLELVAVGFGLTTPPQPLPKGERRNAGSVMPPPARPNLPIKTEDRRQKTVVPVKNLSEKKKEVSDLVETAEEKPAFAEAIAGEEVKSSGVKVSFEEIQDKWDEILNKIRDQKYSLGSLLNNVKLLSLEGDTLHLGVGYKFHLGLIRDSQNYLILVNAVKDVCGCALKISGEISSDYIAKTEGKDPLTEAINSSNLDQMVQETIEVFGGEIR